MVVLLNTEEQTDETIVLRISIVSIASKTIQRKVPPLHSVQ